MELLIFSTTLKFMFPFPMIDGIIPYLSLGLNELNTASVTNVFTKEDNMVKQLCQYSISITNKDVYSLYPHNNIVCYVIYLWTS